MSTLIFAFLFGFFLYEVVFNILESIGFKKVGMHSHSDMYTQKAFWYGVLAVITGTILIVVMN